MAIPQLTILPLSLMEARLSVYLLGTDDGFASMHGSPQLGS